VIGGEQRVSDDRPGRADENDADPEVTIRFADRGDRVGVMGVLEGALLDVDASEVRERIAADAVLVACASGSECVRGALVLGEAGDQGSETGTDSDPDTGIEIEIEAIAVRRRYRDRGIGSALVDRVRHGTGSIVVAEFDERVRPFYAALGFRIEPIGNDRFRGRDAASSDRE
jgi:ribosomal protein S18 acetylase RimI-like enzyme